MRGVVEALTARTPLAGWRVCLPLLAPPLAGRPGPAPCVSYSAVEACARSLSRPGRWSGGSESPVDRSAERAVRSRDGGRSLARDRDAEPVGDLGRGQQIVGCPGAGLGYLKCPAIEVVTRWRRWPHRVGPPSSPSVSDPPSAANRAPARRRPLPPEARGGRFYMRLRRLLRLLRWQFRLRCPHRGDACQELAGCLPERGGVVHGHDLTPAGINARSRTPAPGFVE